MSDAAVFSASVHAIRTVGSRKVVQVVLEAPIEQFPLIARVCEHDTWVGVARLQQQPAAVEKKPANREAQKAAMLCDDPRFHTFLREKCEVDKDDMREAAREYICSYVGIDSRKELKSDDPHWNALQGMFEGWKRDL